MDSTDFFLLFVRWTAVAWLPLAAGLAIATVWNIRSNRAGLVVQPPVTELWLGALLPLVPLLWGAVAYSYATAPGGAPPSERSHWAFRVLDAVTLLSIVVTVGLTYRHRLRPAISLPAALFQLGFAALAWFIASMSIGNDWV